MEKTEKRQTMVTTHNTKYRVTQTQSVTGGGLRCPGKESSFCFTSGTCHVSHNIFVDKLWTRKEWMTDDGLDVDNLDKRFCGALSIWPVQKYFPSSKFTSMLASVDWFGNKRMLFYTNFLHKKLL